MRPTLVGASLLAIGVFFVSRPFSWVWWLALGVGSVGLVLLRHRIASSPLNEIPPGFVVSEVSQGRDEADRGGVFRVRSAQGRSMAVSVLSRPTSRAGLARGLRLRSDARVIVAVRRWGRVDFVEDGTLVLRGWRDTGNVRLRHAGSGDTVTGPLGPVTEWLDGVDSDLAMALVAARAARLL
jgi:hypothetical protein